MLTRPTTEDAAILDRIDAGAEMAHMLADCRDYRIMVTRMAAKVVDHFDCEIEPSLARGWSFRGSRTPELERVSNARGILNEWAR